LAVVFASPATNAGELKWQRAKTPSARSVSKQSKHQPKFERRLDGAVRQVAFEDEGATGPRLTSGSEGRATARGIVAAGQDVPESVRTAQLPFGEEETEPVTPSITPPATPPDAGLDLEDELRTPFGELPQEEPQVETPEMENGLEAPPPTTEEPRELMQPDDRERQPVDRPPSTFRPLPPLDRTTTEETRSQRSQFDPAFASAAERQKACENSLSELRAKTIDTVNLDIAVTGTAGTDYPYECSVDGGLWHAGRCWPQVNYLWKASALCHKPLYFEDEQLERYGHSWPPCVQPIMSGAHFFTTLPVLPYCMGVEPPTECIYALGHYRPGSCAPYMCDPIPISPRGALFQAGAVVGAAAAIP
jgi:hypothetical protein